MQWMRNSEKLRQRLCLRLEIFFEFYLEDRSATCMVAGRLPLVYHDPLDPYRKAELQNGQAGPDALRSIGCVKQYHDTIKLTKRSSPLSRKKWLKRGNFSLSKYDSKYPLPRLALPLIEQNFDFVQLVFPPSDAPPRRLFCYFELAISEAFRELFRVTGIQPIPADDAMLKPRLLKP